MATLQIVRPDTSQLSLLQIAVQYPPIGWEEVFNAAYKELELASHLLSQLEPYFPPKEKIFRALDLCPLHTVKVVILGQDPYHTTHKGRPHANGMAFSSERGTDVRPSLKNIYNELEQEYGEQTIYETSNQYMANRNYLREHYKPKYYGAEPNSNNREDMQLYSGGQVVLSCPVSEYTPYQYEHFVNAIIRKQVSMTHEQIVTFMNLSDAQIVEHVRKTIPVFSSPDHGDLTKWAEQGVLLLNSCLTVAPHQPGSHKRMWNGVIRRIFEAIADANPECIFLLWGKPARDLADDKLSQRAIRLEASHPSPLSAYRKSRNVPSFIGCGHFRKVNEYLKEQGKEPIDWFLD